MRYLLQACLFAALLQVSASACAQQSTVATPSTAASVARSSSPSSDAAELVVARQQIRLLESQIQMVRDYQGSMLSTVYWALGGVFVLVGLLLGFGWFANFKVYERDKESLRSELAAGVLKTSSELASTALKTSTDLEQSLRAQTAVAGEALAKSLKSSIAEALKPSEASIASIQRRIFKLEIDRLREKMQSNPSDNMALTDALELLELCQTRAQDEVPDVMHFMLKKIDKGGRLTAREITRVNAVIDILPGHYKALTDKVRAKLVASDIF